MGPPRPGRKVVYADDTRPSEDIVDLAENADVLIHDGTFASDLEERLGKGDTRRFCLQLRLLKKRMLKN